MVNISDILCITRLTSHNVIWKSYLSHLNADIRLRDHEQNTVYLFHVR